MSDITATANRVIPIDTELYFRDIEEFPDLHVVNHKDSEFKIQLTCQNKDASSPYAVAASDISGSDKQEIVFLSPEGREIIRKATFGTSGTDGIIFYICQSTDLDTVGVWQVRARITEGDVEINYPNIPFTVE